MQEEQEISPFIQSLFDQGVGRSPQECQWWWDVFCGHIAHWLITQGEPVDFRFMKVHTTLLRANWQQLLMHSCPSEAASLQFHQALDKPIDPTKCQGLLSLLTSGRVLAMPESTKSRGNKIDLVRRRLEVELPRVGLCLLNKVEGLRRHKVSLSRYAFNVHAELEQKKFAALDLFRRWVRDAFLPSADLYGGYSLAVGAFLRRHNTGDGARLKAHARSKRTRLVPPRPPVFSPETQLAQKKNLSLSPSKLQKVPALPSPAQDVRDPGQAVPGPQGQSTPT